MRLKADQLQGHLKAGLKACYLIAGSEPLIALEAADQVRAAARANGIAERRVFDIGAGFDWYDWRLDVRSLGLFGQTRLIELRFPNLKFTQAATETIGEFLDDPGSDTLLVTLPEWSKSLERQAWIQSIDQRGAIVTVWPLSRDEFREWLRSRARLHRVQLSPDAFEELNSRAEGNLLAADQELAKISLLTNGESVDAVQLVDLVADHSRYDVYALWDAVLAGDADRIRRILRALRAEGEEPAALLWYLINQVQTLMLAAEQRGNLNAFWPTRGVFGPRVRSYERVLSKPWAERFREAGAVDAAAKGRDVANPWVVLERWLLRTAQPEHAHRFAA